MFKHTFKRCSNCADNETLSVYWQFAHRTVVNGFTGKSQNSCQQTPKQTLKRNFLRPDRGSSIAGGVRFALRTCGDISRQSSFFSDVHSSTSNNSDACLSKNLDDSLQNPHSKPSASKCAFVCLFLSVLLVSRWGDDLGAAALSANAIYI
jgi:hypothetical protein